MSNGNTGNAFHYTSTMSWLADLDLWNKSMLAVYTPRKISQYSF